MSLRDDLKDDLLVSFVLERNGTRPDWFIDKGTPDGKASIQINVTALLESIESTGDIMDAVGAERIREWLETT